MSNRFMFALFVLLPTAVFAIQPDVQPVLRKPDYLFEGNKKARTVFISDSAFKGGFGLYLYDNGKNIVDSDHLAEFKTGGDVSIVSFGLDHLLRMSFTIEGLADSGTKGEIDFKMRRTGYDVSLAYERRFREHDVLSLGWHHRCMHGSDHFTDQHVDSVEEREASGANYTSRVTMRSGPEFKYAANFDFGSFRLINDTLLNVFMVGQNIDKSFQPRVTLSSALQFEYPLSWGTPFASVGLYAGLVTADDTDFTGNKHYYIWDPIRDWKVRFSPAAAMGVIVPGGVGELRVFVSYISSLDTGFKEKSNDSNFFLLNAEFWI